MKEMSKNFDFSEKEVEIYKFWENGGFFSPDRGDGEPFSIMMPPPNVTGILHLGHALENVIMDIVARFERMRGRQVLILPGTDHAAVATQARVEKNLMAEGIKNPRQELGREGLLKKIREYAENSKQTIISQVKRLGTSADWSRLAYTFDEERSRAVNEVFKKMFDDGLIYRGYRVVNWSVKGQSTLSDDELEYETRRAKLYTFKYSQDFPISIATTRPETKLGDTAVAVNPHDERYKDYIGQTFVVDVGARKPLQIKVIGDESVDPSFGTGALGVTPAHSQIDFEMYEKQKALENDIGLVQVIGEDGKMTSAAGSAYQGLKVEEAREKFVSWLKEKNLLEKEEEIEQNVGTSDRFKDVVEAVPKEQWFVAVNKVIPGRGKTFKDLLRASVTVGHNANIEQKITISPERFERIYLHWIDNLRDWCISRQIWWGHRIPVWYRGDEVFVGDSAPEEGFEQDSDTLDTWFSSGLWTFSTLGWPENTDDLKKFHPTSFMQMGHEIIFFWMARMILFSTYILDEIPFREVYIHGLLRNKEGKKFSKSEGNASDPLDIIRDYGTDALRLSLVSNLTPGNDSRFYLEKVEGSRNLVTKLWNMSRFIIGKLPTTQIDVIRPKPKTLADDWILARFDVATGAVEKFLDERDFSQAAEILRSFMWNDMADWYLEICKVEEGKEEILNYLLNNVLKLWHPFLPFVTEAIWQEVYGTDRPLIVENFDFSQAKKDSSEHKFDLIVSLISAVRSLRSDYGINPSIKLSARVGAQEMIDLVSENKEIISALGRLGELTVVKTLDKLPSEIMIISAGGVQTAVNLEGAVDFAKEKERIAKEIAKIAPFVKALEAKLSNSDFALHAPKEVVEKEQEKLAEAKGKLLKLEEQQKQLF